MNANKYLKFDDLLDELRAQTHRRIDDVVNEGRKQARQAGGGHDGTAMSSMLVLGLVAGAVGGAALALLFTPYRGEQARAKLDQKLDQTREKLGDKIDRLRSDGATAVHDARDPMGAARSSNHVGAGKASSEYAPLTAR